MSNKDSSKALERTTIYKERMFTTSHHYFWEVKRANNGSKYIVIDQRRKVGEAYESAKMRVFEDELLEFQRILQKMIRIALGNESVLPESINANTAPIAVEAELLPPFFDKLLEKGDWQDFERYTLYLLRLLGIQAVYSFVDERQAGKADGFFKFGNLAVLYDCTLDRQNIEESKKEQIINYCNRLQQGSIELVGGTTEEFQNHHKQVWLVTRGTSRRIKIVNGIVVKEVAVRDLIEIYRERLKDSGDESLETRLRNV